MLALTNTRALYQDLSTTYVIVGVVVFAIVVGVLLAFLLHFRAGRGGSPKRKHNAIVVEVSYVLLLVGVFTWLMTMNFGTFDKENRLTTVAEHSAATRIDVIGAQWNWRFAYPGRPTVQLVNAANEPTPLYVPAGRLVLFSARSQDVLHDFWIPDLRFQRQVWPDHVERWALVFPHAGTYSGLCAWFCGLNHDRMDFVVHALAPRQFDAWLARKRSGAAA